MSKLTRVTGKVFGATASTTNTPVEIGQFGSAKAGTYNATNDVATIQNLSAWSNGWIDAVTPTDQFPSLPEMTGVHKVLSYQNAYVLQEGIPEYDANTTYYENSICKGLNADDKLVLYRSVADNNTGNALTDALYWEELALGGGSRNIGEIVASAIPLTDAGVHLLDGSQLQYGSYKSFIDYIAGLYDSGDYSAMFTTEADWQSAITSYGVCGKFVYDSVNNTVRLPRIYGFTEGASGTATVGDLTEAGLPNITGQFTLGDPKDFSGALYKVAATSSGTSQPGGSTDSVIGLDASRSSSIYGNSSTVQPQSIKVLYYIVIANTTKTQIEVDIDEIATDLNNKADVDLTNINASCKALDGQWVGSILDLFNSGSATSRTHDLSSYLPTNDKYEVMFYFYFACDRSLPMRTSLPH